MVKWQRRRRPDPEPETSSEEASSPTLSDPEDTLAEPLETASDLATPEEEAEDDAEVDTEVEAGPVAAGATDGDDADADDAAERAVLAAAAAGMDGPKEEPPVEQPVTEPAEQPDLEQAAAAGPEAEPPDDEPDDEPVDADNEADDREERTPSRLRLSVQETTPVLLTLAAHPRQAVGTALAMAAGAAAMSRPGREIALVLVTVLVGQTVLGWHNDIVDRARDARHLTPRKPIAEGRLDVGTAWFAVVIGVLLLVPLSLTTGITAGSWYLGSVAIGLVGNLVLRKGLFSWVPWAASFALLPFYLSHGGFGGSAEGDPPRVVMVVLVALLGVGVHLLRAIWGLVADDEDGWTYLPLRLGRRLGATRLLVLSATYSVVVVAVIAIVGSTVGLRA